MSIAAVPRTSIVLPALDPSLGGQLELLELERSGLWEEEPALRPWETSVTWRRLGSGAA